MTEGTVEKIVREEIGRHGYNAFTELSTEIMLSDYWIIGIYLGKLKRFADRYADPKNAPLSKGERDIRIKIESVHEPVTKLWLERGFEFFERLGEKNVRIRWENIIENIKSSKKARDIISLIQDFNRVTGKFVHYEESPSIPLFEIFNGIENVRRFVTDYATEINLDVAALKNYSDSKNPPIKISRSLFDFRAAGTNPDAEKYAKMTDEFLR